MEKPSTISKLKKKEKDTRRNIIIDAAEEEFATKPFNEVTMRDIAKRAGISPALIYRHFPDQKALFVEAFVRGVREHFYRWFDIIKKSENGAIDQVTTEFIDYFTRHDQYFRMMMNFFLEGSVDPGLFEKLNELERNMIDHFDIMLEKIGLPGNIRYHSHTLFAAMTGIVATFRNHPLKSDEDVMRHRKRIAQNLVALFKNRAQK